MHFHLGCNVIAIEIGGQEPQEGKAQKLDVSPSSLEIHEGWAQGRQREISMSGTQLLAVVPSPYSLIPSL